MTTAGEIRIGISGWTYASWRGVFYPKGLAQRCELAHAASVFRTIEINGTFYSMQTPDAFANWADSAPNGFVFAVKAPRFITHMKRLRDTRIPLANFMACGLLRLGPKLGPILWQLPPTFRYDRARLETFLSMLPHDTNAAVACGRSHDARLKAPAWLRVDAERRVRHAVEIRHLSFRNPEFIELLREYNIALVCADTVDWPCLMDLTADFVYCRLHGSAELYRNAYTDDELSAWATRVRAWSGGRTVRDGEFIGTPAHSNIPRDVFMYFDNTDKMHAPEDAQKLIAKLGPMAQQTTRYLGGALPCTRASGRSPLNDG
jgi:uncharacterized protein YecE (DUF72 family)